MRGRKKEEEREREREKERKEDKEGRKSSRVEKKKKKKNQSTLGEGDTKWQPQCTPGPATMADRRKKNSRVRQGKHYQWEVAAKFQA